jgi:phosphoglycerate dehydrogenase-like enzyme
MLVALLLAVSRKITLAAESLKRGEWDHALFDGLELRGKSLGLIGYGNIGTRIERFMSGFGMDVSRINSKSSQQDIDSLLHDSDVVCICAPLNDQTHHLLDARRLHLLKKHSIIINVGRGAIIDQKALVDCLNIGSIRGVGLDVFEDEPLTGKPSADIVALANMPSVIATPHIAYNTDQTIKRLGIEILDNIHSCIAGAPIHLIH